MTRVFGHRDTIPSLDHLWEFPVEDSLVLVRPDIQGLFLLNPSARLIWELTLEGLPQEEIIREFAAAYRVSAELARRDVTTALKEWEKGLLAPEKGGGESYSSPLAAGSLPSADPVFAGDYLLNARRFRVILYDRELVEEIAPRLQPLIAEPSDPEVTFSVHHDVNGVTIFRDDSCVGREELVTAARGLLLQEIVRACHGDREWLAILHAGACGTTSSCVLFPASTNAGKSTLASALMYSGLSYFGDDSAPIERGTLRLVAMPFAIMLREGSWAAVQSRFPEFGSSPIVKRFGQNVKFLPPKVKPGGAGTALVTNLVFTRFQPEAAESKLTALGTFEALLRLQETGFWVAHDPESIGTFLTWLHSLPAYELIYTDLDEAVGEIRRIVMQSL